MHSDYSNKQVQVFAFIKLYGKIHFEMAALGKKCLHLANKCIITVQATKATLCQKCHLLCPQTGALEDGFDVQLEEGGVEVADLPPHAPPPPLEAGARAL